MSRSNNKFDYYDRLIDLAISVAEGKVDPLDININKFIEYLKKASIESFDYNTLYKDIKALNGLILILEAQYKSLRDRGLGLYIEPLLLKLKVKQASIKTLAGILAKCWHPTINIYLSSTYDLLSSLDYYNSLKPLKDRRIKMLPARIPEFKIGESYLLPEKIEDKMKRIFDNLLNVSEGGWVDYHSYILNYDEPLETAFIISLLVSAGLVEMRYRRLENRYYIRPTKPQFKPIDYYSLPVNVFKGYK